MSLRVAALAVVGWGAIACTGVSAQISNPPGSGRSANVSADEAAPRTVAVVYAGSFSYVRIERAEPGAAANLHPASFTAASLRELLAAVTLGSGRLFNDDELTELVPPLVTALARAAVDQDVSFAIAGKHYGLGLLAPRSVTTGRVFMTAEGLQLIIGLAQRPFESQYVATGHLIPFDPGRRHAPVDRSVTVTVAADAGSAYRADWLVLRSPERAVADAAAAAVSAPRTANPDADAGDRPKALQRSRD